MYNRFDSLNRSVSDERNNNPQHPIGNNITAYGKGSSTWLNHKNGETFFSKNGQRSNYYDSRTK